MVDISKELKKEVGRGLILLAKPKSRVLGDGKEQLSRCSADALFEVAEISSDGRAKKTGSVSKAVLNVMLGEGWIKLEGGGYRISDAGRRYMRRCANSIDPFQSQHQDREFVTVQWDGRTRAVLANQSESPLAWLRKRRGKNGTRLISDAQFEAGERLREDFWFAQMSPSVTANWSPSVPQGKRCRGNVNGSDMADHVIAAKVRVDNALGSVGPELTGVLIDVCCHMNGLEVTERSNGWPQRSGKIVLVLALRALARHYGLERTERANRAVSV